MLTHPTLAKCQRQVSVQLLCGGPRGPRAGQGLQNFEPAVQRSSPNSRPPVVREGVEDGLQQEGVTLLQRPGGCKVGDEAAPGKERSDGDGAGGDRMGECRLQEL